MNPVRDMNVPPGDTVQQISTAEGYSLPKEDYKYLHVYVRNV